jgi:hypothetical protein
MEKWRLVPLQTADAYTNMAVDEAILKIESKFLLTYFALLILSTANASD